MSVTVFNIHVNRLKKTTSIMAIQRSLSGLYMKRKPMDVIVPGKIQKAADVWRMSARWWRDLQRKLPNFISSLNYTTPTTRQ